MSRIAFSFMGTAVHDLALDPEEYRGLPAPKITEEIKKTLRDIRPDVSFFDGDIEFAAEVLANAIATEAQ